MGFPLARPIRVKSTMRQTLMQLWLDADACPSVIRDILFRAAERTATPLTLVANQSIPHPRSRFIRAIRVGRGLDAADDEIVQRVTGGDLVITADIPLAAEVIQAGCVVLSPRGELITTETVRARLTMRDFMETLRASGIDTGGPAPLGTRERQAFANHLDRLLTQGTSPG